MNYCVAKIARLVLIEGVANGSTIVHPGCDSKSQVVKTITNLNNNEIGNYNITVAEYDPENIDNDGMPKISKVTIAKEWLIENGFESPETGESQ